MGCGGCNHLFYHYIGHSCSVKLNWGLQASLMFLWSLSLGKEPWYVWVGAVVSVMGLSDPLFVGLWGV